MRALLIESDHAATRSIEAMLGREGIYMNGADTGEDGIDQCRHYDYDIVILNLRFPNMNGLDVIRALRKAQIRIPILVLSATTAIESRVNALDAGADDYLTMPFHESELVARIRALVRRSCGHSDPAITTGKLTVDLASRTAAVNGITLMLTNKEYQILELLALRRGTTLNAEKLINHIYADGEGPESPTVELFICRLRKKLADATGGDRCIETIKRRGYLLRAAA
jgi:two-component system cell cycle response regulator CtrA